MREIIDLHMTRPQFMALYSLVLNHFLDSKAPGYEGVIEWIDVAADATVTIEDLLALLSTKV